MNFKDQFQRAAFIERAAYKNLKKLYNIFSEYSEYITPYDGYSPYDICLHKYNDGLIKKTIFIEIKVRTETWDTYFLETKKYTSIKRLAEDELYLKPEDYKILYLNFTPTSTLLFDTDIIKELEVKSTEMNIATMSSRTKKKSKTIWELPVEKAKSFKYIWSEDQLKAHTDEYFNTVVKEQIQKKGGLDWLFEK